MLTQIAAKYSSEVEFYGEYSMWQYEPVSPLREKAICLWQEMFGEKPNIQAVHGGLECGVLKGKYPNLDMISLGPDLFDVHTPREYVSLPSVSRTFSFVRQLVLSLQPPGN